MPTAPPPFRPPASPVHTRAGLVAVLIAAQLAPACTASLESDNDVVTVAFPGAHDIADRLVVPGVSLCPDTIRDNATSADVTACYELSGADWDTSAGCLSPSAAGQSALTLTPVACTINDAAFTATADSLTVEAVDPAGVVAGVQWLEDLATEPGVTLVTPLPTGTIPAAGDDIRIAVGATLRLAPELRRATDDVRVGWSSNQLTASVDGAGVSAVVDDEGDAVDVTVDTGADARVDVTFTGAGTWPLASLVADAGPYTLDSVYTAVVVGEDGTSQPLGARAVVRNGAGELVFGAPVTWSSDRLLVTGGVEAGLPSSDYASVSDGCRDPNTLSGEQQATLTATLGTQSVTVDVVWTPPPGDGTPWTEPAECAPADTGETDKSTGCGCATGGEAGAGVGMALGALAVLRRRARRG